MTILECKICNVNFEGYKNSKYCILCKKEARRISNLKYFEKKIKKKLDLNSIELNEGEIIKQMTIENFNHYYITSLGRVFGKNGEVKKHINKKNKYYCVQLCSKGKRKTFTIHRLLALHFLEKPNDDKKKIIDHIDRNRQNNNLDNLRWTTIQENCINSSKVINKKGFSIYKTKSDKYKDKIYYYYVVQIGKKKHRFKTEKERDEFVKKIDCKKV